MPFTARSSERGSKAWPPCRKPAGRCTELRHSVPFRQIREACQDRAYGLVEHITTEIKQPRGAPESPRKPGRHRGRRARLNCCWRASVTRMPRCAVPRSKDLSKIKDDQSMVALITALQDPTAACARRRRRAWGGWAIARTSRTLASLLQGRASRRPDGCGGRAAQPRLETRHQRRAGRVRCCPRACSTPPLSPARPR